MSEQPYVPTESLHPAGGPTGLDDVWAASAASGGAVIVANGVHVEPLPVANMTVGEIRRRFADRMDIDPLSQAQIDGRNASDGETLRAGQQLDFVRRAGEKGWGIVVPPRSICLP